MSFTRIAIERRRVTFTLLAVLMAAGVATYFELPRSEDPGFVVRTALITTVFPGASPERVEELVTDPIEEVVQEIPQLDFVTSESKTGVSLIFANFKEEYTNMRPIFDDLRRKVEKVSPRLPASVRTPIVNDEFGDVFGTILGITGDPAFSYRELREIADEVRDELLLIDEVAKVEIYGAQDERIFVEYNNARLSELGLSPLQLQSILEAQNIVIPGGEVRTEYESIVLEPSGNFESIDELRSTVIRLPGRREVISLRDVADVHDAYVDPPDTKVRIDGTDGLALAISMREGGNIGTLGREVRTTMDRLRGAYPIGIEFREVLFQSDVVERKIADFRGNLLQAVLIVTLVMLAFLGLRTGLIVASLIPASMISAIFVMGRFEIGLDQMSIASLIIALGMLVDNAIVVSESILVEMREGKPAVQAAVDSAAELRTPLLVSSLTTAAAFLPIYLAESSTGEYTAPLFKVVTITLLCSWVLALTMVPLLCTLYLRVERREEADAFDGPGYRFYRAVLRTILRRRILSLAAVALLFAVSLVGFRFVPSIFFPPNDRPLFTIELDLPYGTPLARTEAVVHRLEERLAEARGDGAEPGVRGWATFVGRGAPRFVLTYTPEQRATNHAMFLVDTDDRRVIDAIIPRIETFCRERFPDVEATIRPLGNGPPAWPPVEVRVSGRDLDRLFEIVERLEARLAETPGTKLISNDWGSWSKKLIVRVDQPRARRAGVTSQDVAVSLQTFLSGLEVTEFRRDEDLIPVVLRSIVSEREDVDRLETLNVYAQATGRSVPLSQVADLDVTWQPSVIHRYDRIKTVTVGSAFRTGSTATDITDAIEPWLDERRREWPPGYGWAFGGEAETSAKANASIAAKLPVAGLLIVLLLVSQFDSIRRPLIILLTIPLSLIGVVVGLLVARSSFGFMTLLGIISLAGIVINNAIVLLDRIRIEIEDNGLPAAVAVVEASQRRMRPILLTTCTTIGGLIPLWLAGGPMWEPMAVAIIFGLAFATLLTLGVVPLLYAVLFRVPADPTRPLRPRTHD